MTVTVDEAKKSLTHLLRRVERAERWQEQDTAKAARAWSRHIARRREHPPHFATSPVTDVLIGGFAMRFDGLITRTTGDFRALLPSLRLARPH